MRESAFWHGFVQRCAAPGADGALQKMIAHWLAAHPPRGVCLDVGCGPHPRLRAAGLKAIGVDVSETFVHAVRRDGGAAEVACATALPFGDGAFAGVWSFGLLHHLPDEAVRSAVGEMRRVTCAGGWTVIFDAVRPHSAWRRPLAALLRAADRGGWMRSQAALEALLRPFGDWQCERMTYAWTGLEGLWCALAKDGKESR